MLKVSITQCPGTLDDATFRKLFYETMAIINNCTLNVDGINDPMSLEPLTPNHVILMTSRVALPPPGKFVNDEMYTKKGWHRVQYSFKQFLSRWNKDHLLNASLRQKWNVPWCNLNVNDIVIIKEDALPRNEWFFGRVVETLEGPTKFNEVLHPW